MRPKPATTGTSEQVVKDIRRTTRKQYSAEEKIRIVLEGHRGGYRITKPCRRLGIAEKPVLHKAGRRSSMRPANAGRLADQDSRLTGLPPSSGPGRVLVHDRPLVYWDDGFRCRWVIAQGTVRP